jgi:type VI secretion system protein ImpF
MPPPTGHQTLVVSILDRLVDADPGRRSGESADPPATLAAVRASVKRDLEWLLNCKRSPADLPEDLRHLQVSALTYGLPDFTASSLNDQSHRDRLRRAIEQAIARFEPRLSRVRVSLVREPGIDRNLRFQIDAMLRADPAPVAVTFDSTLELATRSFVVGEEAP